MDKHTEETGEGFGTFYCDMLREHLQDFDNDHLKKLMVLYYDRWNWETGNKNDSHFVKLIEEIMEERNDGLAFYVDDHALVLKVNDEGIYIETRTGLRHEIFALPNGNMELGYELKRIIIDAVNNEIRYGGSFTSNDNSIDASLNSLQSKITQNEIDITMMKAEIDKLQRNLEQKDEVGYA